MSHLDDLRALRARVDIAIKDEEARLRRVAAERLVAEGITSAKVRAWARENGIRVGLRGRVPADVVKQYAATRRLRGVAS